MFYRSSTISMWGFVLHWLLYFVATHEGLSETEVSHHLLVFGGQDAPEGKFPWMVALYFKGTFFCSSTLISDRLVLTAAHCFKSRGKLQLSGDYVGHAGSRNSSYPKVRLEFKSLKLHPDYNPPRLYNDVAILVTKKRVLFDALLNPLCLLNQPSQQIHYHEVQAMGWGVTNTKASSKNILKFVRLKVMSNWACSTVLPNITSSTLCATGIKRGLSPGDSGGPLVASNLQGSFFQIGIASYISYHPGHSNLSVYARTSSYNQFISGVSKTYKSTVCFK